jgi:nitrogen fixation NifU-like protein
MANNTFYNEILTEHNINPFHKHELEDATDQLEGVNPSCGDDIILKLKVGDDGKIVDGSFVGDGCAISQASADMMLDLVIGKTKEEALRLADIFIRMIKGDVTPEEKDELEEAGILEDISHMPARVKCAVLGWHTLQAILGDEGDAAENGEKKTVTTEDE